MGVFRKLKDVLFDIEEDDIPEITKKEEINPIKEIKIPKEETEPPKPDKKEPTFNFPLDDFDEKPVPSRVKKEYNWDEEEYRKPLPRETKRFEEPRRFEEPAPRRKEPDFGRFNQKETRKKDTTPFKPSPVISPVYGILDQNYTKEDIIVKNYVGVTTPNLDDVRKKAYGAKKSEPVILDEPDEFTEPLKTLDEILIDKDEHKKVETPKIMDIPAVKVEDDELPDEPYKDEIVKEKPKKKEETSDNTLESDLFDLIDSMYEDREESEE